MVFYCRRRSLRLKATAMYLFDVAVVTFIRQTGLYWIDSYQIFLIFWKEFSDLFDNRSSIIDTLTRACKRAIFSQNWRIYNGIEVWKILKRILTIGHLFNYFDLVKHTCMNVTCIIFFRFVTPLLPPAPIYRHFY